ncbi:MFS transporter, partial [Streptomyces sp. NPDC049577]|uniref:MFS transporter n=1 Tax=Streptomyces sp. NPDC049577 TaxID=3155153 RepID=UPI00343047E6
AALAIAKIEAETGPLFLAASRDGMDGDIPAPVAAPVTDTGPAGAPGLPAGPPPRALLGLVWPTALLLLGITALYGGYSVVWAVYLRGLGAPDALVAWSAACIALPALLLSPRAGRVLPGVPRTTLLRGAALLLGGCALLYPLTGSVAAALALSLTEGVLLAVALPLISAQVARDAGPGRTARAFGVLGTADALGSGLGTAAAGTLLAQGGTAYAFRFCGVLCLLCAALSLLSRLSRASSRRVPDALPTHPSPSLKDRQVTT